MSLRNSEVGAGLNVAPARAAGVGSSPSTGGLGIAPARVAGQGRENFGPRHWRTKVRPPAQSGRRSGTGGRDDIAA